MGGGLALFARSTQVHPVFRNFRFDWSFWLCLAHVCLLLLCAGVISLARGDCVICRWKWRSTAAKSRDRSSFLKQMTQAPESAVQYSTSGEYKLCVMSSEKDTDMVVFVEAPVTNNSVVVIDGGFLERQKRSDFSAQCFRSLEGIPRMVDKNSGKNRENA